MKKTDLYLGGEDITSSEMMPRDFADFLRAFLRDLFGGKR